jgi:hypothetical protein
LNNFYYQLSKPAGFRQRVFKYTTIPLQTFVTGSKPCIAVLLPGSEVKDIALSQALR